MDSYAVKRDVINTFLDSMLKVEALPDFDNVEREDEEADWRDEANYYQQQLMVQMDKYAELARALGLTCDSWFGDPLMSHNEAVDWARVIREKAWAYDELCD